VRLVRRWQFLYANQVVPRVGSNRHGFARLRPAGPLPTIRVLIRDGPKERPTGNSSKECHSGQQSQRHFPAAVINIYASEPSRKCNEKDEETPNSRPATVPRQGTDDQLTDGGPPLTPELPSRSAGPPVSEAAWALSCSYAPRMIAAEPAKNTGTKKKPIACVIGLGSERVLSRGASQATATATSMGK